MYSYCYVCSVLCILFHYVVLCIVCVYMCTVLLPPGVNPIAVNKIHHNGIFLNSSPSSVAFRCTVPGPTSITNRLIILQSFMLVFARYLVADF